MSETNWTDKMVARRSAWKYPFDPKTVLLALQIVGYPEPLKKRAITEKLSLRKALDAGVVTECQMVLATTVSSTVYWMFEMKRWKHIMNDLMRYMPVSDMQLSSAKLKSFACFEWILVEVDAESTFPKNLRSLVKEFKFPLYRAVVLANLRNGRLRVFAIDYGFFKIISENSVFRCPPAVTRFPSALVLCVLPGIHPVIIYLFMVLLL